METGSTPILRAATVGTFDGLHRGHAEVIRTLKNEAAARRLIPTVLTFDRHPLAVIAPEREPGTLIPADEKVRRLHDAGVDVKLLTFTPAMMAMTAREWLVRMRDDYGVRLIVVGYDNTFGCDGRTMSPADYVALGHDLGVEVTVPPIVDGCSSSKARKAVAAGDMEKAAWILGHPYTITGTVTEGDRIGRTLGFPTANIQADGIDRLQLPPHGVYLTKATLDDDRSFHAVTNIGMRPSIKDAAPELRIETHLLDFDEDIYGRRISIELLRFMRPERRFPSLEALKEAIAADRLRAREESVNQFAPQCAI